MWIIVGDKFLRADTEGSTFYNASLGSWDRFDGLLPEYIYDHIRSFTLALEGLFRSFEGAVVRQDEALLQAIDSVSYTHLRAHETLSDL
eukprot:6417947-Karenia_brevis.AAC.1